jgi:hypothetical protein
MGPRVDHALPVSRIVSLVNIIVPDTRIGHCLEPEGNGVSSGEGVEGGQAPQTRREISSQLPARKESTWSRRKKERRLRRDKDEPACRE